jgi:DNA-binding LacI/PurR family transcriptional regulator
MKILILEDSFIRIEQFKKLFRYQELFIFNNVKDAYISCKIHEFNLMLLDHDLGNRRWVDSNEENTGYTFVKWLVDNESQKQALCYIHSMNFVGANRMMNYLLDHGRDAIWRPFHLLKF